MEMDEPIRLASIFHLQMSESKLTSSLKMYVLAKRRTVMRRARLFVNSNTAFNTSAL